MEAVYTILEQFGIGLLGASIYTFIAIWKRLKELKGDFSWSIFYNKHKNFLLSVVVLLLLVSATLEFVPTSKSLIEMLFGFNFEASKMGFLWLGIILSGGTDYIGKKNVKDA